MPDYTDAPEHIAEAIETAEVVKTHPFSIEVRPSSLQIGRWVVHIRVYPHSMEREQYQTFETEQEALEAAPDLLKVAIVKGETAQ